MYRTLLLRRTAWHTRFPEGAKIAICIISSEKNHCDLNEVRIGTALDYDNIYNMKTGTYQVDSTRSCIICVLSFFGYGSCLVTLCTFCIRCVLPWWKFAIESLLRELEDARAVELELTKNKHTGNFQIISHIFWQESINKQEAINPGTSLRAITKGVKN